MRITKSACALHILCAGLAVALLALPTAADLRGEGLPHVSEDYPHPSACRSDDARCLALQRDVCDPWNITATDKYVFKYFMVLAVSTTALYTLTLRKYNFLR